jgi:hypothetical protein
MASTQPNQTPRTVLSGLFGPKFLDDPDAISGMASSLGMGGPSAPSASPDATGVPNTPNPGPVTGVVPKSFNEWASDPVNVAKVTPQVNNSPLPGLNPSIPPLIARPQDDSAPSAPPTAPQEQEIAARGITAGAPPSPSAPSGAPPPIAPAPQPSIFPNRADWLAQNPNAAPIPLPPHKYGTRGSIAMALATIGDTMGAALTGGRPVVGPHWLEQTQAGIDYQRNLPVVTQQAQTAAYEKAQEEASKSASITGTQATAAHTIAETQMLLGGSPFYKQVGEARDEIQKMWQAGNLAPADFDKAVAIKLQGLDPRVRNLMNQSGDFLQQVKALPQQPPQFKIGANGTIEPLVWRGGNYGAAPSPNEPPEITASRNTAVASQKTAEYNKVDPIITSQIGPFPATGTPEEQAAWGKKAEAAKTRMNVAPKIQVLNATNPFANAPAPSTPGAPGSPTTPEQVLAKYTPKQQSIIQGVANYTLDPKMVRSNRNPAATAELMAAVREYNPQYDETAFGEKTKLRNTIATQSMALNTATHHLDQLSQAVDALQNGNVQIFNKIGNAYGVQTGADPTTNFNAIKSAVAGELSKVFKGGMASDKEISEQNANLSSSSSPAQLKGAINNYINLMQGRLNGLGETYEGQIGIKPNFQIVSPRAQEVFNRAGQNANQGGGAGKISVTAPDGSIHNFPDQASADKTKAAWAAAEAAARK